jgi:hypothetical protein
VCGSKSAGYSDLLAGHILTHDEWTNCVLFHPKITISNMKEIEENFEIDWYEKSDPPTIKVLPKKYFRHAIPSQLLNEYEDLIFLSVQKVKGSLNESFELDNFPFDSQRLHIYFQPKENYKSVMLRPFEIPFEDIKMGVNNDRESMNCEHCVLRAPSKNEEVKIAMVDSTHGVHYVDAVVIDGSIPGKVEVQLLSKIGTQDKVPSWWDTKRILVVSSERVRRKFCLCSSTDIKRGFRNHISRWATKTCPEFDFHYATVRTYLDASALTNTYSVFEFAVCDLYSFARFLFYVLFYSLNHSNTHRFTAREELDTTLHRTTLR